MRTLGLVVLVVTLAACDGASSASSPSGHSGAVASASAGVSKFSQCMLDSGFHIAAVHEGYPGDPPWYSWSSEFPATVASEKRQACASEAPPAGRTDAELRVIYDRWVWERACLIDLGYSPAEPPTFEKFVADWRSTGPWTPLDGVDYVHWTGDKLYAAKQKCTLEVLDSP